MGVVVGWDVCSCWSSGRDVVVIRFRYSTIGVKPPCCKFCKVPLDSWYLGQTDFFHDECFAKDAAKEIVKNLSPHIEEFFRLLVEALKNSNRTKK